MPIDPPPESPAPKTPVDILYYLALVISQHQDKPKFMAMMAAVITPLAETIRLLQHLYAYYDVDQAVGTQLDAVGVWVGRSRFLPVPINAWFSWDTEGLGWDEAVWRQDFSSDRDMMVLDDDPYRQLLYAVILANSWDGTIPGANEAWEEIFGGYPGYTLAINDREDSSMAVALLSQSPPTAIALGLFSLGELNLKPAGIQLYHILPTVYPAGPGGVPIFGFDADNQVCSGFDTAAWGDFDTLPSE